jgi:hypothetical protein
VTFVVMPLGFGTERVPMYVAHMHLPLLQLAVSLPLPSWRTVEQDGFQLASIAEAVTRL